MASLTLRKTQAGKIVKRFYGKFTDEKGSVKVVALVTKFEGRPPVSGRLRDSGDAKFENARQRAQREADDFAEKARDKKIHIYALRKLVELRQGEITETRIADIQGILDGDPRTRQISALRQRIKTRALAAFCKWCAAKRLTFATEVGRTAAGEYVSALAAPDAEGRTYSRASIRGTVTILRAAFAANGVLPEGAANPFSRILPPARAQDATVSRSPLSREEEARLLAVAAKDKTARDIILTALHTGQRRGDIFNMRWENIDLQNRTMRVRQSKTSAVVKLPLSRVLLETLSRGFAERQQGDPFVFPFAAKHPDKARSRIQGVFRETFGSTCTDSGKHKRAANTRGLHSLRTTFISRRLAEGWTIEQVSLFTGHSSAETVYKHYHKASALDLRDKLEESLA